MSLVSWLGKLRERVGPLLPKHYMGVIQKAKTTRDLLDIVSDFDKHIAGPPDRIFLTAAAKKCTQIPSCPPRIASGLLDRIPVADVDEGFRRVACLVLNKAASVGDPAAAWAAFARIPEPNAADWTTLLRACSGEGAEVRAALDKVLGSVVCSESTHPAVLTWALKKAASSGDPAVLQRVWNMVHPAAASPSPVPWSRDRHCCPQVLPVCARFLSDGPH